MVTALLCLLAIDVVIMIEYWRLPCTGLHFVFFPTIDVVGFNFETDFRYYLPKLLSD